MKIFDFAFQFDDVVLSIFKKLVYLSCFFYFASHLHLMEELYVEDALHVSVGCKNSVLSYLSCFPNKTNTILALAAFFVLTLFNFFKDTFVSRLAFWIILMNVFSLNIYILDGGNNLISLISFFLIFTFSQRELVLARKYSWIFQDVTAMSVFNIKFQIVLLYFIAGLGKATEKIWQNGTAIYYSLANPEYSLPLVLNNLGKLPLPLLILPAYSIIIFQIFLGPLLSFKKTKKVTLAMLFLFHLFIFIVMGLGYFAIFMWVSHAIFYERNYFLKVRDVSQRKVYKLKTNFREKEYV
jgi:hypothetical protein